MTTKPGAKKQTTESRRNEVEMKMTIMLEDLLTAREAAELLGTNASRVRQLVARGRIAAVKKGNLLIVDKSSVLEYLKTKSRRGRPPLGSE